LNTRFDLSTSLRDDIVLNMAESDFSLVLYSLLTQFLPSLLTQFLPSFSCSPSFCARYSHSFYPRCSQSFFPRCSQSFCPLCSQSFRARCSNSFFPRCSHSPHSTLRAAITSRKRDGNQKPVPPPLAFKIALLQLSLMMHNCKC
jgi:hypothetical protein